MLMESLAPIDVAKVYLSPMPPDVKQLVTCCELKETADMLHDQMMFMLPANTDPEVELLWERGDSAVARTYLSISEFERPYYIYMRRDTAWKVSASRSMSGTDLAEYLLLETRDMDDDGLSELDSSLQTASEGSMGWRLMMRNARLLTATDDDLVDYFYDNRAAFDTLKQRAFESMAILVESRDRVIEYNPFLSEMLKQMALQDVTVDRYLDERHRGILFFQIGGSGYDSVGYLFAEPDARIPNMWADRFIYVHALGEGWYVFRTS